MRCCMWLNKAVKLSLPMELTEVQYERIKDALPVQRGNVSLSNLQVLNAVLYVAEQGCKSVFTDGTDRSAIRTNQGCVASAAWEREPEQPASAQCGAVCG